MASAQNTANAEIIVGECEGGFELVVLNSAEAEVEWITVLESFAYLDLMAESHAVMQLYA